MKRFFLILFILFSISKTLSADIDISRQEYWKLNNAFYSIFNLYVDSVSDGKLVEYAIKGMLNELDPHSVYIPRSEVERANESIDGHFEGIGVSFQLIEDTMLIMQTIAGCPAEKVGLLPGDRILSVNDTSVSGVRMPTYDIMRRIRGPKGSEVRIKVLRKPLPAFIDFYIIRDKIPVYTLDAAYKIDKETVYIKINSFGVKTLYEYQSAFDSLKKEGFKHLILDLQGNGGGLLNVATDLTDEFLSSGKSIVYTKGLHQNKKEVVSTDKGRFKSGDLIVLVDEYSASASEILSGALQDWDRALIVGRRTFGKGLVQQPIALNDGSIMRLTVARYYTPTGRCIQKPYENGTENYYKDLQKRYQHGELQNADSIHFPDSLCYKTLNLQRTVYGGGGIMPDVFVSLDTSMYSNYYRDLLAKGVINKTIAQYLEKNKNLLLKQYIDFADFEKSFEVDKTLLDRLIKNGEATGIIFKADEFERSKPRIMLQLKALIARDIWNNQAYFIIINQANESLQKALEIFNTPNWQNIYFINKQK